MDPQPRRGGNESGSDDQGKVDPDDQTTSARPDDDDVEGHVYLPDDAVPRRGDEGKGR